MNTLRDKLTTTTTYIREEVSRILACIPHMGGGVGMEDGNAILEPLMNIAEYAERLDRYVEHADDEPSGESAPLTGVDSSSLEPEQEDVTTTKIIWERLTDDGHLDEWVARAPDGSYTHLRVNGPDAAERGFRILRRLRSLQLAAGPHEGDAVH